MERSLAWLLWAVSRDSLGTQLGTQASGRGLSSVGTVASWEHRDSQLNHLDAERGLAKLSLPGEQSLLKFTISTLCTLQMRWQGWHLGHSWWRGHPQSLFLLLDLALLATPSAPAFCWKSLEGLWTDLCSSLPSLLTFCVAWRKPLGSCKSVSSGTRRRANSSFAGMG